MMIKWSAPNRNLYNRPFDWLYTELIDFNTKLTLTLEQGRREGEIINDVCQYAVDPFNEIAPYERPPFREPLDIISDLHYLMMQSGYYIQSTHDTQFGKRYIFKKESSNE